MTSVVVRHRTTGERSELSLSHASYDDEQIADRILREVFDLVTGFGRHPLAYADVTFEDGPVFDEVRDDVYDVLSEAPHEVAGLLEVLRAGRIDGSCYEGECACLVGTLDRLGAAKTGVDRHLPRDARRPAESWFLDINRGDTPANSPAAELVECWLLAWLLSNPEPVA